MTTPGTPTLRPFHETIVSAISRCGGPSTGEILRLLQLIKDTNIPEGHEKILAAIDQYFNFLGSGKWARDIRESRESLLAQKQVHDERNAAAQGGANLDELQVETVRLLSLLDDPHPGLATWHQLMRDRAESMHRLLSQALGK